MAVKLGKVRKAIGEYDHILIMMRHAQAEPGSLTSDRGRGLTDKGRKQAKTVAKGLLDLGVNPDRIICSGAQRAVETCERMLKVFGDGPKVDYRQSLYDGGMQAILDELGHIKPQTRSALVLGHEPVMSIASQWMADSQSDPSLIDLLNLGFSTASIAVFGSDTPLGEWQLHSGRLLAVISPKDFD